MKWVPIILSGIVVIIGLNVALAIRDSKMYDKLDDRNTTIVNLLEEV